MITDQAFPNIDAEKTTTFLLISKLALEQINILSGKKMQFTVEFLMYCKKYNYSCYGYKNLDFPIYPLDTFFEENPAKVDKASWWFDTYFQYYISKCIRKYNRESIDTKEIINYIERLHYTSDDDKFSSSLKEINDSLEEKNSSEQSSIKFEEGDVVFLEGGKTIIIDSKNVDLFNGKKNRRFH